jgi:glycosyltransferase involved in cell wall biosynthesis
MHVLRHSPAIRERVVLCLVGPDYDADGYEPEVTALGIPVFRVPFTFMGVPFVWRLARFLREHKPRAVHVHMNYLSGFGTMASLLAGVSDRIAHYHNAYPSQHKTLPRRSYIFGVRCCEAVSATQVVGCSRLALESYSPVLWQKNKPSEVIYYGIDLTPFQNLPERTVIRAELGLPDDALVIGHVGRMEPQKNHKFLIDIAGEVNQRRPNTAVLLVGDGRLRPEIEQYATLTGVKTVFTGVRPDVPRLLRAMDVFVFPSIFEGLGIVLVEAEAAGLPCVFSDAIPDEVEVVQPLIRRVSLDRTAAEWAETVLASQPTVTQAEALDQMQRSPFNINTNLRQLEAMYHV